MVNSHEIYLIIRSSSGNIYLTFFWSNRLYWITKRAGEKEGSGLMKANAWHHHADAISSVVALVGVGKSLFKKDDCPSISPEG